MVCWMKDVWRHYFWQAQGNNTVPVSVWTANFTNATRRNSKTAVPREVNVCLTKVWFKWPQRLKLFRRCIYNTRITRPPGKQLGPRFSKIYPICSFDNLVLFSKLLKPVRGCVAFKYNVLVVFWNPCCGLSWTPCWSVVLIKQLVFVGVPKLSSLEQAVLLQNGDKSKMKHKLGKRDDSLTQCATAHAVTVPTKWNTEQTTPAVAFENFATALYAHHVMTVYAVCMLFKQWRASIPFSTYQFQHLTSVSPKIWLLHWVTIYGVFICQIHFILCLKALYVPTARQWKACVLYYKFVWGCYANI